MGFLAALVLALAPSLLGDVQAAWRCEPEQVEVGEPFDLVLEITHPASIEGRVLAGGELSLDPSWALLEAPPARTETRADGSALTERHWRLVSLEPGERALGDALSKFALPESVARIQVGGARVEVAGVLGPDEDAPRPLREFPDSFAGADAPRAGAGILPWLVAGVLATGAAATFLVLRRRSRGVRAVPLGPLERLAALERELETRDGRESCYALTRLLRETGDGLRARTSKGLSDEEWLAEVRASHDIPSGVATELGAVLERAAAIKYAGDTATPWALREIFGRARAALEGLVPGGARA